MLRSQVGGESFIFHIWMVPWIIIFGKLISGESTYAGDRDVRYLNCLVPCEFVCEFPTVNGAALLGHRLVSRHWKTVEDLGRADLFPQGKQMYSKQLLHNLQRAQEALNRTTPPDVDTNLDAVGTKHAIQTEKLPLVLRFWHWNCAENCRYECMVENRAVREQGGEQTVHYYGKWPFTRVVGVQELFSSFFSLLNGVPHLLFILQGRSCRDPFCRWRLAPMVLLWAAVNCNTWLQSTLFHARETPLTELLDYHSATLGLAVNVALAVIVNLPTQWSLRFWAPVVIGVILSFWVHHIWYLSFVTFDYSYNMKVAVCLGVFAISFWIYWCIRHPYEFVWKILVVIFGPLAILPLELLDFPPLGGLVDAHALWHLGTIPLPFLFYNFLGNYAQHESGMGLMHKE